MMGAGRLAIEPNDESQETKPQKLEKGADVALEWSDVTIKFRVITQDTATNSEEFELFPNLDTTAPSVRSVAMQQRLSQRKKSSQDNTLSGYIGSSTSTSDRSGATSVDNQSVISEKGSEKNSSSNESTKGDKPVKHCPICKKPFQKASYLKRHVMSHTSAKPYKCNICNWGFFQEQNLKRHMASHSVQDGDEGFKCAHCLATFTTKSVLTIHIRDAHGEKPATAKKSGNNGTTTPQPQSLLKPNIFKSSPKVHKSPNAMIRSPTNTPTGLNKCNICGKQFLTQANLKAHSLFHRGNKSFKCSICGSRFAQKSNLAKHMQLSHAGHQCSKCTVIFRSEHDLNQHMLSFHPEISNEDHEPMLKLDDEEEVEEHDIME